MSKPVSFDAIRAGERSSAAMRSSNLAPACFAQAIGTFTLVLVGHAAAAAVQRGVQLQERLSHFSQNLLNTPAARRRIGGFWTGAIYHAAFGWRSI